MKNSFYIQGPHILVSSLYRSQQEEGVLESKVGGLQFRFHVKWKEKNHLKICILIYSGSRSFSCAGLLIHSCSRELPSQFRETTLLAMQFIHVLPPWQASGYASLMYIYSVSSTDAEAQLCAVVCPILFSLLLVHGLFSPPLHGERHSPVLWVEPRAAGKVRSGFHVYIWH